MSETLVQNQQPLTQAANQKPLYQRGIDPRKLQSFIMQEHYKTKIKTILGDESTEAADIFKMPGLSWKEKYAEAKTRTSPIIDELDRMEMNIDAKGNPITITSNDVIKYYLKHPELDYKETSHLRKVLSTKQIQEATKEADKKSRQKDISTEEKEFYKQKATNIGHRAKAEDKLKYIEESIRHDYKTSLEKKFGEKADKAYIPEIEDELEKLDALFTKDLDSWNTGEESNLEDIQQALNKLSEVIQFGNTYTTAEGITYSRTSLAGIPDPNYINIVRKKWVEKQMNKVSSARDDMRKIRVTSPEESPVRQAIGTATDKPKGKIEGF